MDLRHDVVMFEDGRFQVDCHGCPQQPCVVLADMLARPADVKPLRDGVYRGIVDQDGEVVLTRLRNLTE